MKRIVWLAFAAALALPAIATPVRAVQAPRAPERKIPAAQIVDFKSLGVHGGADLFLKLRALPPGTFVRFGGQIGTAENLLAVLLKHPAFTRRDLPDGRGPLSFPIGPLPISNLQGPTAPPSPQNVPPPAGGIVAPQPSATATPPEVPPPGAPSAPRAMAPGAFALPGKQGALAAAATICPTQTLCAIDYPTYDETLLISDTCGFQSCGYTYCLNANGDAVVYSNAGGFACPSGTTSTAVASPEIVVMGGCLVAGAGASSGNNGARPALDECAWDPVQSARYDVRLPFKLDHYDASPDCQTGNFDIEVTEGNAIGPTRPVIVSIAQPHKPAEPLAQMPAKLQLVCAVTVYVTGPSSGSVKL